MQTDQEFVDFIQSGTRRLTPRTVHELIDELPDIRARIATAEAPNFPKLRAQLNFLADVAEAFAEDRQSDLPYDTTLEAIFALSYFARDVDLIPDFLDGIGLTDDATVAEIVLRRHAPSLEPWASRRNLDWAALQPEAR